MDAGLAVLTAALAVWVVGPTSAIGLRRLSEDGRHHQHPAPRTAFSVVEDDRRRLWVCLVTASLAGAVVAGSLGLALGALAGVVVSLAVGRLEPPSVARERAAVVRDLPLAVDLLAACSEIGLPIESALPQVAVAVGGPLRRRLDTLQSRLALGASPVEEWQRIASDPVLRRFGLAMVRTHRSGAPVAESLRRVAVDVRRERRARAQEVARSVAVRAAAPLAVCFLPAFMVIGVVPTIVGGFSHVVR